jgi:hypothetical protein
VLEECPFNPDHKAPDAAVFERADGSLGFKCFHSSCSGKSWKDVRVMFEPQKSWRTNGPPAPSRGREAPPAATAESFKNAGKDAANEHVLSGAELLQRVEQYIRRYVILPEAAYCPVALWVVATHVVLRFDCFPYLAIVSAAKRSGKTRLAETLETLVRRPWRGTAPSAAALYRMLEDAPTLLLDETEPLNGKNKSETTQIILAVLNAGHRKGATIPRCEPPKHEVRHFDVYGAKLFAAIGRLPDTLMDRSIVLHMKRRTKTQKLERFRQGRATAEAKPIHDAAARFVETHAAEIDQAYERVLDSDLEFLNDRDADIWTPLFVMCEVAIPEQWDGLKRDALTLSAAKAGDDMDDSYALTLLRDIKTVWPMCEEKCETTVLLERVNALEESPWQEHQLSARKLARMLKPFEIEPRTLRFGEKRTAKGYLYAQVQDALERYLDTQNECTECFNGTS